MDACRRENVAKFLFCLGILEGKAFQLYGRISERVEWPRVKFSLLYLAYDSLKHSVILGELSKSFARSEVKDEDYQKVLGEVWKMVEHLSGEILKIKTIRKEKLMSLARRLVIIYTITLVHLKTLKFMDEEISEAYGVDMKNLEDILELLIGDEEVGTQVLMGIKNLLVKKTVLVDNTPAVKFTSPDVW
jgi:hypothetical protein